MGKDRLAAFSDGVIAIIITIMVLELKVPHGADWAALRAIAPNFVSYVLSFIYLAIYWNNHHHLIHTVTRVDGLILWANSHLLFWLSLVPAALGTLDIRPNSVAVEEGFTTLREAARIESFQAHMHLRGKAMMLEAILPSGQKQVISLVSDFNFNWMTTYVYADDVAPLLPKGTILKVTAWHDNTSAKKSNPDPNQWVGWGDRTVDEMAHAWVNIVYLKDDDFKIEQDKRRATQTTAIRQQ